MLIKSDTTQRKLSGQLPPGVPIFFQLAQIDSRKGCKNWGHRDFQLAGDLQNSDEVGKFAYLGWNRVTMDGLGANISLKLEENDSRK